MTTDLSNLFSEGDDRGLQRMIALLADPHVSQITAEGPDRVSFIDSTGQKRADRVFASEQQYISFLNHLVSLTDAGYSDVLKAKTAVIEGSFRPDRIQVHGSIHICTPEITRGSPALTVRKQPISLITLDDMFRQGMMNPDMRLFLEQAIRGRSNILVSGGTGAGKTTLARALSNFIDPNQRVVTVEEIDELHLYDRLHNVVSLTSFRKRDEEGRMVRETTLDDLVRESLRMRGDRIWVGETRGKEAFALVKACNSGHDGSITTVHADDGKTAVKQLTTYVMESGLSDQVAREQVARAFDLVVQIKKTRMDRRVISEISYLEPVIEGGTNQRLSQLWLFNPATQTHQFQLPQLPGKLVEKWAVHGVNWDGKPPKSRM